jgi:hypothetical protein
VKQSLKQLSKKSTLAFTLIVAALLISTASIANAQYPTGQTINITIDDSGTFTATEPTVGITYLIEGTPGTTGTVVATVYNGNPQATAQLPSDVSLTKFLAVVFDFPAQGFAQGTLTFKLTDSDVAGLQGPYVIYKYNADSNSYQKLDGIVDENAKTITITSAGSDDSIFAMGGTLVSTAPNESSFLGVAIVVAVAIIVIAVVLGFWKLRVRIER